MSENESSTTEGGLALQDGNTWEFLALKELQGGSTTGGNMGEALLIQAEDSYGCCGVAATDDGECPIVGGGIEDCLGDTTCAIGECLELEYTHWAILEDGLGGTENLCELLHGLWSDIQGEPALRR